MPRAVDNIYSPPGLPSNIVSSSKGLPTIVSSSHGLIAIRSNVSSTYHVGNPYLINSLFARLPNPPLSHQPNNSHAALAIDPSYPVFLLICIQRGSNILDYVVHVFDSFGYTWRSHTKTVTNVPVNVSGALVPNTGVGIGNAAFWILGSSAQAPCALLWCNIRDVDLPPSVSILALPPRPEGSQQARMQLGRAMGRLGLVIVDGTNFTVELFTLLEYLATSGRPWLRQESFRIEILQQQQQQRVIDHADGNQEADNSIASWRQEDMTLVCREMPRPIRFDSFKVELLFWVQGRVLLLESGDTDSLEYQLTVIPDCDVPPSITDGIPYVFNGLH